MLRELTRRPPAVADRMLLVVGELGHRAVVGRLKVPGHERGVIAEAVNAAFRKHDMVQL